MKRNRQNLIRLLLIGMIPLLAFSACIKEREIEGGTAGKGKSAVRFSVWLPGAAHASRSLTEDNESHVQTIDILMFAQGGGVWQYRAGVSGAEITTDNTDAAKKTFTITMRHGDYDLMMLANARDKIVALDLAGKTKSQVLAMLAGDVPAGGKWIANDAAAGYKPIPMWGEIGDITIDGSTKITEAEGITLTRMVARVDVLIAAGVNDFKLTGVDVYNYNTKGSLAPLPAAWNPAANPPRATAPNVPSGSVLTKGPLEYNNGSGRSEINTADNKCEREIYLFEAENHTGAGHTTGKDHLDRTCIVVGGMYDANGNGNFTDDGPATYYRADFSTGTGDAETFLDLLRNHHYTFTVTKVNGPGYTTSEDAFQGDKPIDFTVSVTNWGAETHFPLGLDIRPSANCYIMAPGKTFGIPVFGQVQRAMDAGHLASTWIDGTMDLKACLVWAEYADVINTSDLKLVFDRSHNILYSTLSVMTGGTEGNALVAVYHDRNGNGVYNAGTDEIKWSWHIWVIKEEYQPQNISGWMDRDLGMLRRTWVGTPGNKNGDPAIPLYYQWGRKEPFTQTGTAITEPGGRPWRTGTYTAVTTGTGNTLATALQYPARVITDWTSPAGMYCWRTQSGEKGIYDPCPVGYRVPSTTDLGPLLGVAGTNFTTSSGNRVLIQTVTGLEWVLPLHVDSWYHTHSRSSTDGCRYDVAVQTSGANGRIQYRADGGEPEQRASLNPVRCIRDESSSGGTTSTLTTDSENRKILTDGGIYNIKVTSNTGWVASIKKGTNEVTIGDSEVLGLPLLDESTGFNGGKVTGYVSGGTANTTTEKTITVKSVDYLEPYKFAEGDFVILFRDSNTGQIIHETTITVWQGTDPRFARSNIVWDPVNNKLTFAETKADNANIPANVQGVYFKWGSLFPVSPVGVNFDISQVLYTPVGYTGTAPSGTGSTGWATVPYRSSDSDLSGYDVSTGTGDICRYISARGWVRDKWRLPTLDEMSALYSVKNFSYGTWVDIVAAPAGGNNAYGFYQSTGGRMLGLYATSTDNVTAPSYGIYFPGSGYRGGTNGQGYGTGYITYLWTASPHSNISSAYNMYVGWSGTSPGQQARTYGFPVRCVRDLK